MAGLHRLSLSIHMVPQVFVKPSLGTKELEGFFSFVLTSSLDSLYFKKYSSFPREKEEERKKKTKWEEWRGTVVVVWGWASSSSRIRSKRQLGSSLQLTLAKCLVAECLSGGIEKPRLQFFVQPKVSSYQTMKKWEFESRNEWDRTNPMPILYWLCVCQSLLVVRVQSSDLWHSFSDTL